MILCLINGLMYKKEITGLLYIIVAKDIGRYISGLKYYSVTCWKFMALFSTVQLRTGPPYLNF